MQYKLSASDHSSSDGSSNAGSGIAVHFATTRQPDLFQAAKHCTFFFFSWGLKLCVGGIREGGVGRGRVLSLAFTFSAFNFFPGTHTAAL